MVIVTTSTKLQMMPFHLVLQGRSGRARRPKRRHPSIENRLFCVTAPNENVLIFIQLVVNCMNFRIVIFFLASSTARAAFR